MLPLGTMMLFAFERMDAKIVQEQVHPRILRV